LADYFERCAAACTSVKAAANWIGRDLRQALSDGGLGIENSALDAETLAVLIGLVEGGRLTAKNARDLLPELVAQGGDPVSLMEERGLEAVSDAGVIDEWVKQVIQANAAAVESVRAGDDKPLNFLMGKVMKAAGGKANPGEVRTRLVEMIRDSA
jgi:aspartyl-tRNA(Asn)/glutamyl-tRNA(Gln) amidotransferase subunit B